MQTAKTPVVTAIILAAGSGSRMGSDITKQRMTIHGESILRHTVRAFQNSGEVDSIVIVSRDDEIQWARGELGIEFNKVKTVVAGGKSRAESAYIGFCQADEADFVAIHDGARCLITPEMIDSVIRAAYLHSAATAASAVSDTLKKVGGGGVITDTISRDGMYSAQTPQVFSRDLYAKATSGIDFNDKITDDNMLVEAIGGQVYAVETGRENIKITTQGDIGYAEYILERRGRMGEIRIGHGYEILSWRIFLDAPGVTVSATDDLGN